MEIINSQEFFNFYVKKGHSKRFFNFSADKYK